MCSIRLLWIAALLCSVAAGAEARGLPHAERGIPIDQANAFSGCAPAASLADRKARNIALLRAQAALARAKHVTVSGEEHLATGRQIGSGRYSMVVSETSEVFLAPVIVVKEEIMQIDNVSQLCVLVAESK